MRIAHVIDYFQPQLGYQETYLAREQLRAGHQVRVFTSDRYRDVFFQGGALRSVLGNRQRPAGRGLESGIPVDRLTVRWEVAGRVWLNNLERKLADFQPDAIHVHGATTAIAPRVALAHLRSPALRKATLVVDDHMSAAVSTRRVRALYPLFRAVLIPIIRRSVDSFVAVSEDTRDFMVAHYGLNADEISVIRLGVDHEKFRPDVLARAEVRKELDIPDSAVVCIYTGKIMPRKQVSVLIDAIGTLASKHPNLRLLILGYADQEYLATLKAKVDALEIADKVYWHDAVSQDQLPRYFAAADIAVWPAEHSISFLEAMACGLPLLVGDAPKCAEEVAYGNGVIFPVGDRHGLATALDQLLESPELRIRMGKASRQAIERLYTWTAISQQFIECYERKK